MKKSKNEAVAQGNAKNAEIKAAQAGKNNPSDKKEKETAEYPFKKVIYGYDPEEVAAYINELNETYESSSRMHESKLSSMKEELVLSNRERDSLNEKYKECRAKLADSANKELQLYDNSAEYEETIAALYKKLELSERENENLRKAAESKNEMKALEYTDRIAALEKEKAQLTLTIQSLREGFAEEISQKTCQAFTTRLCLRRMGKSATENFQVLYIIGITRGGGIYSRHSYIPEA